MSRRAPLRIVVGEDSVLFREGLVQLLTEQGHDVAAAVGNATALVDAVRAHRPDLAVIDIRMPPQLESDGAEAAAALRAEHPNLGLLLLSQHIQLRHCLDLIGRTPRSGISSRTAFSTLTNLRMLWAAWPTAVRPSTRQ
mgnify:CR=1 FL=1